MNQNLNRVLTLILIAASLAFCGCIVSVGGSRHPVPPPEPPPSMAPVVITNVADVATIAEIDAASRLDIEHNRANALTQLAERPVLSQPVQLHLINVTYRRLTLDNNKTQVLAKLIARPDFSDETRHAIVSQLRILSLDHNRRFLLQQINERLTSKPGN